MGTARKPGKVENFRRGLVATIKIAQKNLGLDDETYRGLLFSVTGEVTSTKCTVKQLQAVIGELRKKGWRPKPRKTQTVNVDEALTPLHGKIRAQLYALEKTPDYADSIIERQTGGKANLKTAGRSELVACIAALTVMQKRQEAANAGA